MLRIIAGAVALSIGPATEREPAHAVVVIEAGMDAARSVVDDRVVARALLRRMGASRHVSYEASVEPDGSRRFVADDEETHFEIEVHPVVREKRAVVEVTVSLPFETAVLEERRAQRLALLVREGADRFIAPPPPPAAPRPYGWQIPIFEIIGTPLFSGPIIHLANERPLRALESFSVRLASIGGCAAMFGGVGALAGQGSYDPAPRLAGVVFGLGTGWLAASLFDVLWISRH